jgi:hypothetical protein
VKKIRWNYRATEAINEAMDHNSPPDELVVPVAMPQVVGPWDFVSTPADGKMSSQCLTEGVDSF